MFGFRILIDILQNRKRVSDAPLIIRARNDDMFQNKKVDTH